MFKCHQQQNLMCICNNVCNNKLFDQVKNKSIGDEGISFFGQCICSEFENNDKYVVSLNEAK